MAHGDQPDGPALLLTPREIDVPYSHCDFLVWEKDPLSGLLSVNCATRTFLILSQKTIERQLLVIELTEDRSFTIYQLAPCGPE